MLAWYEVFDCDAADWPHGLCRGKPSITNPDAVEGTAVGGMFAMR